MSHLLLWSKVWMNAHGMVSNHNKKDNTGNQGTLLCCYYVAGRIMTVWAVGIVVVFVDAVLYWTLFMKCLSVIIKTCRLSLIDELQLFTYRMNLLSTSFCSLQMVQEKKKEHTKYITIWGSWLPAEFIQNASFLGAWFPPHYMILVSDELFSISL